MNESKIPFSVEYFNANPGCKVVTREGNPVRIYDTNMDNNVWVVAGAIKYQKCEMIGVWNKNGSYTFTIYEHSLDLFILTEPKWRPMTDDEAIPLIGCLYRWDDTVGIITGIKDGRLYYANGIAISYNILSVGCMSDSSHYSLDKGTNWRPTKVELV